MENPYELERILETSREEGVLQSEGSFTMAREHALKKLAQFSLPFESGWVLKIIQSIVASQSRAAITVKLQRNEIQFHFKHDAWTLEMIEKHFFDPQTPGDSSIGYLVRGLWPVAVGEARSFSLSLCGEKEVLVWDGSEFTRRPRGGPLKESVLEVGPKLTEKGLANWISSAAEKDRSNTELREILLKHCFTCPVPLFVDQLRVDSLQHCPEYGWNKEVYPVALGYADCALRKLPIPAGTYLKSRSKKEFIQRAKDSIKARYDGGGLRAIGETVFDGKPTVATAAVPFLISFPMKSDYNNSMRWLHKTGGSKVFWVLHGVVVDSRDLTSAMHECTLGCFLNAEGLTTDLTGLKVRSSDEANERFEIAKKAIYEALHDNLDQTLEFERVAAEMTHRSKQKAAGVLAAGAGLAIASPQSGIFLAGLGGLYWIGAGKKIGKRITELTDKVVELRDALRD